MALKVIKTLGVEPILVKVYYDSEWSEYITKAVINGKVEKAARWSHTDDKDDALDTAQAILEWNVKDQVKTKKSAVAILNELEKKSKTTKINPSKSMYAKIQELNKVDNGGLKYIVGKHYKAGDTKSINALYKQYITDANKPKRKANPVKKSTKSYIVQKLHAANNLNGNSQRGWLIWFNDGTPIDFVDEGYRGDGALKDYLGSNPYVDLGSISVTSAVYNMAKKTLRTNK